MEYTQMDEAARGGYIRKNVAGPFLFVDFLPIHEKSKLPTQLVHVTSIRNAERIAAEGLRSDKGRIYVQSPDLRAEPEHISLHNADQSLVCVILNTERLLASGKKIILDPESIHGYVGEFMHSYVIYGDIPPQSLTLEDLEEYKKKRSGPQDDILQKAA